MIEKVTINAPAELVWTKVSNFGDLGAWHPAVAKTEITAGSNNEVGAVRLLTLQDSGKITEKLTAYDPANNTYSYEIIEGVLPVSGMLLLFKCYQLVLVQRLFGQVILSVKILQHAHQKGKITTIGAVYRGGLDNLKKNIRIMIFV